MKRRFTVAMVCALTAAVAVSSAGAKLRKIASAESGKAADCVTRVTGAGGEFAYENPSAKSVFVAGSFNEWNSSRDALSKDKKGVWRATLPLKTGTHQYKFVVDGNWMIDPSNPQTSDDGYGGKNSLLEVVAAAQPHKLFVATRQIKTGIEFVYAGSAAKNVAVAGSFNNWSVSSHRLEKDKSGLWKAAVPLGKGKYQYKFVVDGEWKEDSSNPQNSEDGHGGKNSVIEVR
ncbi:MAG: glycogen-binding domain-containing protein [Endomicrobiia bacterium]|nr:glycogen-binding domain-containing protein [Endomicrobiia bacterium]